MDECLLASRVLSLVSCKVCLVKKLRTVKKFSVIWLEQLWNLLSSSICLESDVKHHSISSYLEDKNVKTKNRVQGAQKIYYARARQLQISSIWLTFCLFFTSQALFKSWTKHNPCCNTTQTFIGHSLLQATIFLPL